MKIKKGDTVKVLVGKDAGRSAKVIKILPKVAMVVVDGLNLFKKHVKGDNRDKKATIVDISKPIHVSNVVLVCPSCSKPTRVVSTKVGERFVRTCKRCGKTVESDRQEKAHEDKKTEIADKKGSIVKDVKKVVEKNSKVAKTKENTK